MTKGRARKRRKSSQSSPRVQTQMRAEEMMREGFEGMMKLYQRWLSGKRVHNYELMACVRLHRTGQAMIDDEPIELTQTKER
jgi:hypothetical protein